MRGTDKFSSPPFSPAPQLYGFFGCMITIRTPLCRPQIFGYLVLPRYPLVDSILPTPLCMIWQKWGSAFSTFWGSTSFSSHFPYSSFRSSRDFFSIFPHLPVTLSLDSDSNTDIQCDQVGPSWLVRIYNCGKGLIRGHDGDYSCRVFLARGYSIGWKHRAFQMLLCCCVEFCSASKVPSLETWCMIQRSSTRAWRRFKYHVS